VVPFYPSRLVPTAIGGCGAGPGGVPPGPTLTAHAGSGRIIPPEHGPAGQAVWGTRETASR